MVVFLKYTPVLAWAECDWSPAVHDLGFHHDATCPWAGPAADTGDEAVPALIQDTGSQRNIAAGGPRAGPAEPGDPESLDFSLPAKNKWKNEENQLFSRREFYQISC